MALNPAAALQPPQADLDRIHETFACTDWFDKEARAPFRVGAFILPYACPGWRLPFDLLLYERESIAETPAMWQGGTLRLSERALLGGYTTSEARAGKPRRRFPLNFDLWALTNPF